MRTNIVLIDFENVQPESLGLLAQEQFRVLVFVGANQTKVPFETAASLQQLGSRAEYIKVAGNGPNALDFHIAYYIGKLAAAEPGAYFHIVSKDTGFDPLIAHLKTQKVAAGRVQKVSDIPGVKSPGPTPADERSAHIVEKLRRVKATRPKSRKTLAGYIRTACQPRAVSDEEIAAIIDEMVRAGAITLDGTKVCYA